MMLESITSDPDVRCQTFLQYDHFLCV